MFTCLRHRTVGGGDNEDCSVHVGGAGNHVFDIVGVPGAIHMSVMPFIRLVFHMGDIDGHATFFFFRSIVNRIKGTEFGLSFFGKVFGDSGSQCCLAVVDVSDSTYI